MSSNHIIGVGGTGTKCVDAMVHLTACGLLPPTHVSLFDQDKDNGNLAATKDLLDLYSRLVGQLGPLLSKISPNTRLFQNGLIRPADTDNWYWQPFDKPGAHLDSMFQINSLDSDLQHLSRCLFNLEYELKMDLTYGFRGRPAVGAAVISGSRDEGHQFWNYVNHLLGSASGDINVFLAGSVFGGTGAAGLPTIARHIKLIEDNDTGTSKKTEDKPPRLTVGAAMMLPYFTYADPPPSAPKNQQQSIARAAELPLRSQLALDFYSRTLDSTGKASFFDTAYLLGLPSLLDLKYMSAGGDFQRNPAMLPELYAGLAAAHFLKRGKDIRGELYQCGVGSDPSNGKPVVRWRDLPSPLGDTAKDSVRARLGQLLRFAFAYFYVYHAYLFPEGGVEHKRSRESWYRILIDNNGTRLSINDVAVAKPLNDYCFRLLEWYAALGLTTRGRSQIDLEQLIQVKYAKLTDSDGEPSKNAPAIELFPAPKGNTDANLKELAKAFEVLLGEEGAGGLEHIYEGLCRQRPTDGPGYVTFVDALWQASALVLDADK